MWRVGRRAGHGESGLDEMTFVRWAAGCFATKWAKWVEAEVAPPHRETWQGRVQAFHHRPRCNGHNFAPVHHSFVSSRAQTSAVERALGWNRDGWQRRPIDSLHLRAPVESL